MFLELAVRRGQSCRLLLGLRDGFGERSNPHVDDFQLLRAPIGSVQPLGDLVEARVRLGGLLFDFEQRLAGRHDLRAV